MPTARGRTLVLLAAVTWAIVFFAVYGVTLGHGLVKDDFAWILQSRVRSLADAARLFTRDNGFYRPVVALTFAADEHWFGVAPRAYAATNLAIASACGAAIAGLARALRLPWGAAVLAAALWLLNVHGIHWAILWTSGRTSLLVTLFGVLSAWALVAGRPWLASAALAAALFSKEEAVLLGPVLAGWLALAGAEDEGATRRVSVGRWVILAGGITLAYLIVRSLTSAMTPFTAPSFYRFTFAPSALARNVAEYADRAATLPVSATLAVFLIAGRPRELFDRHTRLIARCGLLWLIGGYGLTVFVPVRSELYACLPAVGVCLVCAAIAARIWTVAAPVTRPRLLVAAIAAPLLLSPVYYLRTERWVSLETFASAVLSDLRQATASLPPGATVVIADDRHDRDNMDAAFGSLMDDAVALTLDKPLHVLIDAPASTPAALRLSVVNGRLR